MSEKTVLQPVAVVRNEDGYFCHPAVREFWDVDMAGRETCTREEWEAFEERNGIETHLDRLEFYPIDHPAYVAYFDNEDGNVTAWEPTRPSGDGWFLLDISDSEDGPFAVFARHRSNA